MELGGRNGRGGRGWGVVRGVVGGGEGVGWGDKKYEGIRRENGEKVLEQKNECKMGQKVSSKRKNMIKLIVIWFSSGKIKIILDGLLLVLVEDKNSTICRASLFFFIISLSM